ncbi:MAG TPA: amino acid adenylation domain-containing protein, partial [Thermoanaerobaculia bacterium]
MALLAAWALLLGRHAGQDDVLIGTPIAGRNRRDLEGLVGCFINTLPLRTDLGGAPSFRSLLARVREATLDAFAHQDVPFERLVEELVTERDLAVSPLFQALFVLQNAPGGELRAPGLCFTPLPAVDEVAKLDLSLGLTETPGGIVGALEHNTDLFDRTTAMRLAARFAALLAAAVAAPASPAGDLQLLLPQERSQMLLEWNECGGELPQDLCLHELFAAQVARRPQEIAVVEGGDRLSYAQLAARAGGIALRLRALGVGPETRVALCLERSPDLIASMLGVLAAGGAYVPIDPEYPRERRVHTLGDSGAAVLITRAALAVDLTADGGVPDRLTVLDLSQEKIPAAGLPAGIGVLPGHLAYVIYTSGSTGRPKGVAIEHRSVAALAGWARREFSDEELSGVLATTSVCFDLSVFEILVPLAWGGTVYLAKNALELPSSAAIDRVHLFNTVPSAAVELVRSGGLPASVRTLSLAGEPLPGALVEQLYATGHVERVLNLYGPSEDTTYSTAARVPRGGKRGPAIGRPLPGTRALVVDREGWPVPIGVAGELHLAGAGLARGYLARAELTAERFLPDPFGGAGERVYRTGDRVRWLPHGEMEFLGRVDQQVKIRGFRIEPGEIETVLASHPSVRECAVLAREDTPGTRILTAYVAPAPHAAPLAANELSEFLRHRLPAYLVPSAFVTLGKLPLTPNGKVDRNALPAPGPRQDRFMPPRDEVELRLTHIWEDLLNVQPVGIRDNFFALGGHSLLVLRLVGSVERQLGRRLPVAALMDAPTVEKMASLIRREMAVSRS